MTKNQQTRENLIRLRKEAKLSQEELAEKVGINRSTYRNIESGSTKLVSPRVDDIAQALKISAEQLLGYDIKEVRTAHFSDIESSYEKQIVTLESEINSLRVENSRLVAENAKLTEDNRFLKDMTSWMKNELDKRDKG